MRCPQGVVEKNKKLTLKQKRALANQAEGVSSTMKILASKDTK